MLVQRNYIIISPPAIILHVICHIILNTPLFCLSLLLFPPHPDDRKQYSSLSSFMLGPHLLVGLTTGDIKLPPAFDASAPANHAKPIPESANQQLVSFMLHPGLWHHRAASHFTPPGPASHSDADFMHHGAASQPSAFHPLPQPSDAEGGEASGTFPSTKRRASDFPQSRRVVVCQAGGRDAQLLSATCGGPPAGAGSGNAEKTVVNMAT